MDNQGYPILLNEVVTYSCIKASYVTCRVAIFAFSHRFDRLPERRLWGIKDDIIIDTCWGQYNM